MLPLINRDALFYHACEIEDPKGFRNPSGLANSPLTFAFAHFPGWPIISPSVKHARDEAREQAAASGALSALLRGRVAGDILRAVRAECGRPFAVSGQPE